MSNLVQACAFADTAYLVDRDEARAAVTALGASFVELYQADPECQLLVSKMDGVLQVDIRGTQFLEHTSVREILDNLRGEPFDVGGGKLIHEGYGKPFERAVLALPHDLRNYADPIRVRGHSMGGARAGYARLHWRQATVVQVAPPRSANAAFWDFYYPNGEGIEWLVNECDFAPCWPWFGGWTHARAPMFWMRGGAMVARARERPGLNESEPDHSITRYRGHCTAIYAHPQLLPPQLREAA